jgi:hypothetical protein
MSVITGSLGTEDVPTSSPSRCGFDGVNFFLAAVLAGFGPGGELLDKVRSKRAVIAVGICIVIPSALILAFWPRFAQLAALLDRRSLRLASPWLVTRR